MDQPTRYSLVVVCTDRFNFCWFDTIEQVQDAISTWKEYENTRYMFTYDGPRLIKTQSGKARPQ